MMTEGEATNHGARLRMVVLRLAAELGIVVLGVSIALWADGWSTDRREREVESARLVALQGDLIRTLEEVSQTRESADSVAGALRQLVGFTYVDGDDDAVSEAVRYGFFGIPELQPELSVYDDLRSSGELALFSDASLRQALSAMRARVDRLLVYQADLLTVQQLDVDPYVLRRFELSALFRGRPGFEDLEFLTGQADLGTALTADMEARNLALFKLDMLTQFALRLDDVEGDLLSVQQILVAQLERQSG
jgi:hypothetical protein